MLEPTPWFVGGGAEHSPQVARLLAFVASGGAEGIVGPRSLRVAAQAVPSTSVRVLTGSGLILNGYPGGGNQTYAFRNSSQTTVDVDATGSGGGRNDLVIARIVDPQYEGSAPPDPNDFQYTRLEVIKGVSAGTTSARDLNLNYPAIALALVKLPKSTATVTAAMITDLREVANPRVEEVVRPRPLVGAETETLTATGPNGEWFPNNGGAQNMRIPEWATRVQIEAQWIMVREPSGDASGQCWVEWGPFTVASTREYKTQRFDFNSSNTSDVSRAMWFAAQDMYVPFAMRGTDQTFVMKAWLRGASKNAARPQLDATSGVNLRVRFLEVADPSTT